MFSQKKILQSTGNYSEKIDKIKELLCSADKIILGIGSGVSASGGLNYADPELSKKWFPEYYSMGLHSILDIQSRFWWYKNSKPEAYWGYWAKHVWHIRFETGLLKPYADLFELFNDKDYFICTTNADGQVQKSGFPPEKVFAPQGNYEYLQCIRHCSEKLWPSRELMENMISNMPNPFEIRSEDIPRCDCGAPLVPNLRCDNTFVESPHLWNLGDYQAFIDCCKDKSTLLLELGVGYNTPVIIRYPFETITRAYPNATLVRANIACAGVPEDVVDKSVTLKEDIVKVLASIGN